MKANKISLNASKTELIIFRDPKKKIFHNLKIKIDGKKLVPCKSVKYLGIYIDCHLNWHSHLAVMIPKLNRAIGMLSKIRYYVNTDTLKMIYFAIFSSIMSYGSQIWGQTKTVLSKLGIIQNKAIRIITFEKFQASSLPLYKKSDILKLEDLVNMQNFLFVYDNIKSNLPTPLCCKISFVDYRHEQRHVEKYQLKRLVTRTITYGSKSIYSKSIDIWNFVNKNPSIDFLGPKRGGIKNSIYAYLMSKYQD